MKKEACVESLSEALAAYHAGADRLELCSRLDLDGLTPSENLIISVLENVPLPIRVMIRPRGGDFCFSETETRRCEEQIIFCKKSADLQTAGTLEGVVFGFLKKDNTIEFEITQYLAQLATPLKVVFHKAIDLTPDVFEAATKLSEITGITDILTSGGMPTADAGKEILKKLADRFDGQIDIISAGKITPQNIESLHRYIGGNWYHGRRIV